jgi:hypothetical protein
VCFSELRILKELAIVAASWRKDEKRGSEDPPLRERGKSCGVIAAGLREMREEQRREEKSDAGEVDRLACPSRLGVNDENIVKGSISLARR